MCHTKSREREIARMRSRDPHEIEYMRAQQQPHDLRARIRPLDGATGAGSCPSAEARVLRLQAAVALELEGEPAGPSRRAKARRHDELTDETNSAASASSLKRPAQAPRAESVSGHSSGQRCSRDPGSRQWWRAGRHHRGKRRREAGEKKRSPAKPSSR